MSEYSIALIEEHQIAGAEALMSRCFEAKLAPIFYLHPESTLVATSQGEVIAGINLEVYQVNKQVRMGYIGWLYTDEGHRGKALAGKLLTEAVSFLKDAGCTSLSACVEGDNPASFKQLAQEGFSILGLWQQLKLFKWGTPRVYHHASRFFDMGYFLWHKSLTGEIFKEAKTGIQALLLTLLGNTLLFLFCLKGWNLLSIVGLWPSLSPLTAKQQMTYLALPSLFLLARIGSMALLAKTPKHKGKNRSEVLYRGWDTAWILAILLTLSVGFPFPVPGNLYIKGLDWKLGKERDLLAGMALAGLAGVLLICHLSPKGLPLLFGLVLLALDTLFYFYPFCGFNASRIKRMGAKTYGLSLAITLAVVLPLLVY